MRSAKTDGNQRGIVETFRKAGATVQVLSSVGKGFPDLYVGWRGVNYLVEVKSKRGKFTPDQFEFISNCRGRVYIIRSCLEAINMLNLGTRET